MAGSELISAKEVQKVLERKDVTVSYSDRYESAYCIYEPNAYQTATVWYQSEESMAAKLQLAKKPLENYRDIDAFKTYVSDVGLLCAKKEIVPDDILYPAHDLDDFKGGMAENYVCDQLTASGHTCYYWTGDGGRRAWGHCGQSSP